MPDMIPGDERLLWGKARLVERIIELEDLLACCDLAKRAREKALVMVAENLGDIYWPTEGPGRDWCGELSIYLRGYAATTLEVEPDFMRYLVAIRDGQVAFAGDPEIGKYDTEVQAEKQAQADHWEAVAKVAMRILDSAGVTYNRALVLSDPEYILRLFKRNDLPDDPPSLSERIEQAELDRQGLDD